MSHNLALVAVDDGAEVGLVVVATFAILILVGLYLISAMFGAAFKKIPIVGPPIGSAFDWVTRWARGALIATLHGTLWACGKIAHAFMAVISNTWHILKDTADAIGGALEHMAFVVLPREIVAARQFTLRQVNQVYYQSKAYTDQQDAAQNKALAGQKSWTQSQLLKLQNTLVNLVNATRSVLDARITDAVNKLTAMIQALGRKEAADFAKAEADIKTAEARVTAKETADIANVRAQLAIDLQAAELHADQVAHAAELAAIAAVDASVAAVETQAWPEVTAMIGELSTELQDAFPAVSILLGAIPAAPPVTAPAAVAAADAVLPPIIRLMTDCVVPECRDMGPTRNALHLLQSAITDAALLAWFAEMVQHPQQAADDTAAILGPITSGAISAVNSLLGGP